MVPQADICSPSQVPSVGHPFSSKQKTLIPSFPKALLASSRARPPIFLMPLENHFITRPWRRFAVFWDLAHEHVQYGAKGGKGGGFASLRGAPFSRDLFWGWLGRMGSRLLDF